MAAPVPAPRCPVCGNGLFHCGLAGWPHWCGACDWRGTPAPAAPPARYEPAEEADWDGSYEPSVPDRAGWWVVCDDHAVHCKDEAAAERKLAEVARLGACPLPHHLEYVVPEEEVVS